MISLTAGQLEVVKITKTHLRGRILTSALTMSDCPAVTYLVIPDSTLPDVRAPHKDALGEEG